MEKLLELDGNILLWIQNNLRNDFLDAVMKTITSLGDHGFIWIILTVLFFLVKRTRRLGFTTALSMLMTLFAVNIVIKNIVARTRPYEVVEGLNRIIGAQDDFSFPSGHTAHAFAFSVVIFLMLSRKWGMFALVFAFLMGFTRLYVGVHYPTDVIAAALIGTVMAFLSVFVVRRVVEKFNVENDEGNIRKIDEK